VTEGKTAMAERRRNPSDRTRREFIQGVGLGGLALVLGGPLAAACAPGTGGVGGDSSPKKGGSFIVAMDADAPNLNPMTSQVLQTFYPSNQIFDTLVKYDKDFQPIPWLARSWKISPDGKTFEFTLAQGVKWHDGKPFSSDDIRYTFEEAGPKYSNTYTLVMKDLESIDAPEGKVVFHFRQPVGALMAYLGDPNFNILPKHIYSGTDPRTNNANSEPVGTGPFMFKEWARGDHLTLARNSSYWQKDLPYLDEIVFRTIPNAAAAVAALQQGDISFLLTRIPPVDAQRLKSVSGITTLSPSVLARTLDLWPNLRNAPLRDLKVRQAINIAVDRPRMVQSIAFDQTVTARGPIGTTSPYFDSSLPELKRDVQKANDLLDAAGYRRAGSGTRFPLNLRVVASVDQFAKTAQIVKENLADVGIDVTIVAAETTTTLDAIFKRWDFDLAIYSMPLGPEPSLQLPAWLGTTGINRAYFSNAQGYSNDTVDSLTAQAQRTVERKDRMDLYKKIQQQIMADLPLIPLWEPIFISGYRNEFRNAFTAPDDRYLNWTETWKGA